MKIIDLLNKIANGEEVPNKIKYHNKIYNYEEFNIGYGKDYFNAEWKIEKGYRHTTSNNSYIYLNINDYHLNDEVEVCSTGLTVKEAEENFNKISEVLYKEANKKREKEDEILDNLEEKHKIPEKLKLYKLSDNDSANISTLQDFNNRNIQITINEILDYLEVKNE